MRHSAVMWGALGLAVLSPGCRTTDPAGAVKPSPNSIVFQDVSSAAGLRFTHETGADGRYRMPESLGPGCAFLDYDGDGWQDIFLVNGTSWPDRPARRGLPALYRNQQDGTFREVTDEAGLAVAMYGMGCAVGDMDNDGHDDLLVTAVGANRLFRNRGNGTFHDITRASGLTCASNWDWHTSAAWLDYDRDGLLDLFIGRYVKWTPETDVTCTSAGGQRSYCGPQPYGPDHNELFRNLGGGRFREVTMDAGVNLGRGKALGVIPLDEDEDGWVDVLVANDLVPNLLFRNRQGKRFEEVGQEAGIAVGTTGEPRAGMGIDAADVGNDGQLRVAIGNFAGEGLALFQRDSGFYTDVAPAAGLVPASLSRLTFGLQFLDADQDGWQDLFTYNGHVDPLIEKTGSASTYRQLPQLFRNQRGRFVEVTGKAEMPLQHPQVGRGCAQGDFDNDGRPDLLLSENGGPARLLRNVTESGSRWLGIRLRQRTRNCNAYGAEVRLTAGGMVQRRWVRSGGGYLSQSDQRALFGLGVSGSVEQVEIGWPSGKVTSYQPPALDTYLNIEGPE